MWYLIYSGYKNGAVIRIDTDRNRAIAYAEQYTHDTEYDSWVIETEIIDWLDCDDAWNDKKCIYRNLTTNHY